MYLYGMFALGKLGTGDLQILKVEHTGTVHSKQQVLCVTNEPLHTTLKKDYVYMYR